MTAAPVMAASTHTPVNDALFDYCLYLADSTLLLGHRNSEWCAHGPVLEQDIALTNISLDLIGQARLFYQYAASLKGEGATEDTLAYLRDVYDFKNCLLTELPNGDWGQTILRQFFFSAFQYYLFQSLQHSKDTTIAAICQKALKEITYHVRWSAEWVIRLGDGTAKSHQRMVAAVEQLWPYVGELFIPAPYETAMAQTGTGVAVEGLRDQWQQKVAAVLAEATLPIPGNNWSQQGGKTGRHSEHLGYVLAEMQFLQRTYPGCEW